MPSISSILFDLIFDIIFLLACGGYVRASPDKAYVITGIFKKKRYLIGHAGFRIPFFEKKDSLHIGLVSTEVNTIKTIPTSDYIGIGINAVANVKISSSPEQLPIAAENFLNRSAEYIGRVASEIIQGSVNEAAEDVDLQYIVSHRRDFAKLVKQTAEPKLETIGLELKNFIVLNFDDDDGVIREMRAKKVSATNP